MPSDDNLADEVFKAGVEFYANVGTYCPDTERIIKFTEEEIKEALAMAPSAPVFGEGKEARKLVARKPESDTSPWCFIGAGGAPVSTEELFVSIMEAYGSFLPLANSITTPTLTTINGVPIRAGSPLEVLACIRSTVLSREALRRAGRPGLPIMNSIATAVSDTAKIAGSQFGLRPSDGWLIGTSAELKLEFQRLNEIAYVTSLGGHIVAETAPLLGGYCGGPEGVAVTNVAYHLNCIMAMQGSCQLTFPIHYKYGCTTTRDVSWAVSVSSQAISRNSNFPFFILSYTAAGPMTKMCLYEIVVAVTTSVVSGASIEFGGVAKATAIDHFTPMEPRFASEVAHSVVGLKRADANAIVKKLLAKYEDQIENAPLGKRYEECWDIKAKKPLPDYVDLYEEVKKEPPKYGLQFKYWEARPPRGNRAQPENQGEYKPGLEGKISMNR
ncbi:monomethylamine:corrinoid methyltransferase [Candidatus Hakubella thermalkaliphila]|uniref:monomethylamine:corrinoid methyltransferase n=1 Tax=Candidatus Hakubella thermalkaliphila TaxID=2754717 RepID=UPI00215918F7|nr:monomethylamine:corrinoid methyltransferase [Candidatus Hakubella thermalkaliphila]